MSKITPEKIEAKYAIDSKKRKRIRDWKTAGFNKDAVAVYGGSLETLLEVVNTGHVPHFPENQKIGYHKKIFLHPEMPLYYVLPFGEKLKEGWGGIFNRIREQHFSDEIEALQELNVDEAIDSAKGYAYSKAFRDAYRMFTKDAGNVDLVLRVAQKRLPNLFNSYFKETGAFIDINIKQNAVNKFESRLSREIIEDIIPECLSRRGILFFFNSKLLDNLVFPGYESRDEIMVQSDKPLRTSVISGIEFLGPREETLLNLR